MKLSTSDVPTLVPASLVPSPLNSTSPGCEPPGSVRMEPATGDRRQAAAGLEHEAGVVAAAVTDGSRKHQVAVDRNTDGQDTARGGNTTGTSLSEPLGLIRSTETWLLPASTASRNRPSGEICSAPCDASPAPVPAPPAVNGILSGG